MASIAYDEQTLQVGDLGRFSMRAIYDALATSTSPTANRRPQHADPEDSDCSWTQDDDNGTFYFDMQKRLSSFASSDSRSTITTAWLTKSQRRFVHATSQILRLGHASLGPPGKVRRMVVFKDLSNSMLNISALQGTDQVVAPPSKKRRRLERVENGFPCNFCKKVFDRASERTKHEQAHQPSLTARHPCPVCGKAFRYPKDLRRHSRIHEKLAPRSGSQSLSTSYESSNAPLQSTLTADSRVPSETSLTFSSNAASINVSPVLLAQNERGVQIPGLNLGTLEESGTAWVADADDWLFDPRMGFDNGQDEDFLEMAMVRKQVPNVSPRQS